MSGRREKEGELTNLLLVRSCSRFIAVTEKPTCSTTSSTSSLVRRGDGFGGTHYDRVKMRRALSQSTSSYSPHPIFICDEHFLALALQGLTEAQEAPCDCERHPAQRAKGRQAHDDWSAHGGGHLLQQVFANSRMEICEPRRHPFPKTLSFLCVGARLTRVFFTFPHASAVRALCFAGGGV